MLINKANRQDLHIVIVLSSLLILLLSTPTPVAAEEAASFEQLITDLHYSNNERQWNAIEALGSLGDKRAVPLLILELRKDMVQRKGYAMVIIPVLGQLGDERAIPVLIESLNKRNDDWLGREYSAHALGDIGSNKAVPALIHAAWMADTRDAAISALATIGDPAATDVLISAFYEGEDPDTRQAAIDGLVHMGKVTLPLLIEKLEVQHQEQAYSTRHERATVAAVLGMIGDHRAIGALKASLNDPDEGVRKNAKEALERMSE